MVPGTKYLLPIAASAVVGALGALIGRSEVEAAVVNVDVWVQPGTTGKLSCGWHPSACTENPLPGGHALDWDKGTVYWRSYGWCSAVNCGPTIATGSTREVLGGVCTEFKVLITATVPPATDQGEIRYVHATKVAGGNFAIKGDSTYPFTQTALGETVQEDTACPWRGEHLHQTDKAPPSPWEWNPNNGPYPWQGDHNPDCFDDNCGNTSAGAQFPYSSSGILPIGERAWHQVSQNWTYIF